MKKLGRFSLMAVLVLTALSGCATTQPNSQHNGQADNQAHSKSQLSQGYSGSGGMTAYNIKPEAYEYHYDHGFTGIDEMGWDANLQYAWSRAGAALTCNIDFDKSKVIAQLVKAYGYDELVHDMNGIMFHNMQSQKLAGFCTPARVQNIKTVLTGIEQGNLPKPF